MLMGWNGSMVSGGVFWKQMAETEFGGRRVLLGKAERQKHDHAEGEMD